VSDSSDKLTGPIVLFVGCSREAANRVGLRSEELAEAYGHVLELAFIASEKTDQWWAKPFTRENMHRMTDVFTRRSQHTLLKWTESGKFVTEVREILEEQISGSIGFDAMPDGWEERVTLVYIHTDLEPSISPYVGRVFDGWFPNAVYRDFTSGVVRRPLWRGAPVPPAQEVLFWPACQLPGLDSAKMVIGIAGIENVFDLVLLSRSDLKEKGWEDFQIDEVEAILGKYGLRLGMTNEEIAELSHEASVARSASSR
jgi:hypothetical protein